MGCRFSVWEDENVLEMGDGTTVWMHLIALNYILKMVTFNICLTKIKKAFLVSQIVKNLSPMQETWVWSLGWEDSLEKKMATHSSILAWEIPWTEEPGGLYWGQWSPTGSQWVTYHGVTMSRTWLCDHTHTHNNKTKTKILRNPIPIVILWIPDSTLTLPL